MLAGVVASALFISYTGKVDPVFSTQNIVNVDIKKPVADRVDYSVKLNVAVVRQTAVRVNIKPVADVKPVKKQEVIPDNLHCPQYYLLAKEIGWPSDQLERLDFVMWRESRCDASVHNKKDPAGGSRGLIQINGYWCRPNRFTDNGFLQDNDVLVTCDDLFDPRTNLSAGLAMYNYGIERSGCGWSPWSTRKSRWC